MSAIEVLASGLLTTVQDLGRPGHAAEGISASGAADSLAVRIGNRLLGNDEDRAVLEMTLLGGTFRFLEGASIALTGSDAGARIDGAPVPSWQAVDVVPGATLACGAIQPGARAYLCVRGGIAVSRWLGSASTHLLTALGGHEGRPLASGDRLRIGPAPPRPRARDRVDASGVPGYKRGEPFRVTAGPQADWFDAEARAGLAAVAWRVSESCDRMGIRLEGPAIALGHPRELLTEGVCLGAVQITASGQPIILLVEHQTTGGYPKIANVVSADLARLGTLRPRDRVEFETVTLDEAHALLRAQEEALDALFR